MPCAFTEDPSAPCPCSDYPKRRRACEFWLPSRNHKYARCAMFLDTRTLCPLPKSACKTCPHFLVVKKAPPPNTVMEKRVRDNREFMREHMRKKRAEARKWKVVSVKVVAPGDPDYPVSETT